MAESRTQRRLAAILAADVVGYSRLMETDEAGTLSRLRTLRRDIIDPSVASHSGRIVKLMGDGALVEFASALTRAHTPLCPYFRSHFRRAKRSSSAHDQHA